MKPIDDFNKMKKIGICAHSYEGAALCFLTACREGSILLGPHMHPDIILSAVPMGLSMPAWESNDFDGVGKYLLQGVEQVAKGGADFFICPDNTAHLVLERIINDLPIPGLHIADVVCHEIMSKGWKKIGLLGTKWTMTGSVYANALEKRNLIKLIPEASVRAKINEAIFEELCLSIFRQETIDLFIDAIETLKKEGAECVILGCTEIPLIIDQNNSPLPILDSTRLLAQYAVRLALEGELSTRTGWLEIG